MLPAHLQELLTAAVDGEMDAAERRLVDKLLRESDEARAFYVQLLADANRLRRLPMASPGDDLAASIMSMIDNRGIMPTPLPRSRGKRRWDMNRLLPWVSMGTAVGVIIVVSVFSYLYIDASERQLASQNKNDVDKPQPTSTTKDLAKSQPVKRAVPALPNNSGDPEMNDTETDDPLRDAPIVVAKEDRRPNTPELVPVMPRVIGLENIDATPVQPESEPFRVVRVRLSVLLPLRDLDQPYPKTQLRDELRKDEVIRLDLFCKDSTRAAELIQAGLKARGQQLLVDALAHDHLKKRQKGEYVFFTENMTADEIIQLLEHLGADDKKAETKKAGEGQFDKFMLAPFMAADMNELAKLLGIPAAKVNLPKMKATGTIDPLKSLESMTAQQLAAGLSKGGSRGNERFALVLPYGTTNFFPTKSKEVKLFLDKRGERKANAVPMMLVLRTID